MLILIYGITGMVGQPTARAALNAGYHVRGLGRNPQKLSNDIADRLEKFVKMKDAYDISSLDEAVRGVDAIISSPSGAFETALDGQILLLRAVERAGVKLPLGFHEGYDPLISFCDYARLSSPIKPIHTFTGGIADFVYRLPPGLNNPIDKKNSVLSYFGTGDEEDIVTTVEDLALYTIQAITEPHAADGGFRFVESFRVTMNKLADAYEETRGVKLQRKNLGAIEDVERMLAEGRSKIPPSNYINYAAFIYLTIQLRGLSLYVSVDSRRWSHIKQTGLKEWLQANPDI